MTSPPREGRPFLFLIFLPADGESACVIGSVH